MRMASSQLIVVCLAAGAGGCLGTSLPTRGARVYGPVRFVAGRVSEFPMGTRTPLETRGVFVFHDARGFQVMEAVCTHRESVLYWQETLQQAGCVRCGSSYGRGGRVVQGPAVKPLPFYHCEVRSGHLWVDRHRAVDASFFGKQGRVREPARDPDRQKGNGH